MEIHAVNYRRATRVLIWGIGIWANAFVLIAAPGRLVIAESTYKVGALRQVSLDSGKLGPGVPIHSDAIVRGFPQSRNVYVVNRLGQDNIQIVSPDLSRTLSQLSVGRRSNPQDLALINEDLAYLTRFGATTLRKINPHVMDRRTRQALLLSEIDLSPPATVDLSNAPDSDGVPDMTFLHLSGTSLLVSLQRIDQRKGFIPTGKSLLAVVDTQTDRVKRWQLLARTNPVTDFKTGPDGALYLGEAGRTGRDSVLDGGIEKLNPISFQSEGVVADEKALDGDIIDFEVVSAKLIVAIVANPEPELIAYDPSSGIRKLLAGASGYTFLQLALDRARGLVYLADRNPQQPRIRVFDLRTLTERTERVWKLDLPPYQMILAP